MKTNVLAIMAILAIGVSMLAPACALDVTGAGEEEVLVERSSALTAWQCGRTLQNGVYVVDPTGLNQNKKFEVEASIAATLIKETGRLEPDKDLEKFNNKIRVKSSGACGSTGCPETRTLLAYQTLDTVNRIKEVSGLNSLLVTHWDRFQTTAMQSWTGCTVSGQHISLGSVVPATAAEMQAVGASTVGVCAPYGVPDSVMYWYRASQNPGKLWCKMMAFGGPTGPSGNPENHFVKYAGTGASYLAGVDPMSPTPVAITSSAANTAAGNTALYIGNGMPNFMYTRPETPGITYTHSTTGAGLVRWRDLGCYVNGTPGTYQPSFLQPNAYVYCRY